MPPDGAVLTVEHEVNLLVPARGDVKIARGRVTKPGRTLPVCTADVVAAGDGGEKPVATKLATRMAFTERPGVPRGI